MNIHPFFSGKYKKHPFAQCFTILLPLTEERPLGTRERRTLNTMRWRRRCFRGNCKSQEHAPSSFRAKPEDRSSLLGEESLWLAGQMLEHADLLKSSFPNVRHNTMLCGRLARRWPKLGLQHAPISSRLE